MNYFLSGGAKNGKSSLAQEIVCAQSGPRYYLATMIPHDDEDRLRIQRHLDNRAGMGFQTVECGTDILSSLSRMELDGAVLLDSVTALLSNEMFRATARWTPLPRRVWRRSCWNSPAGCAAACS